MPPAGALRGRRLRRGGRREAAEVAGEVRAGSPAPFSKASADDDVTANRVFTPFHNLQHAFFSITLIF